MRCRRAVSPLAQLLISGVLIFALNGCGGSAPVRPEPPHPEVYGADTHLGPVRFGRRVGDSGGDFLVPNNLTGGEISLISQPVAFGDDASSLDHVDASLSTTVRRPHRIEVLADGPGALAKIAWEETCGVAAGPAAGQPGVSDGSGTAAHVTVRLPAVIRIALPHRTTGSDSCAVAAMISTRGHTAARLSLVNY